LSRASVRRCLYAGTAGYVSQQDGHFALRPRVLHLGHAFFSSSAIVSLAQPVLDSLSARVHETSALAILDGTDILYLVRSEVQRVLTSHGMGSRLPATRPPPPVAGPSAKRSWRRSSSRTAPARLLTKISRPGSRQPSARPRHGLCADRRGTGAGIARDRRAVRSQAGVVLAAISVSVKANKVSEGEMIARLLELAEAAAAMAR
jgi:IclR family pca regulon transcriptional regulator